MSKKPRQAPPPERSVDEATVSVLPMEIRVGDRLTDEQGEWEVIGRPFTTVGGKNANVRVRLVEQPAVTEIRVWGAHERVGVKRDGR